MGKATKTWRSLGVSPLELRPDVTLTNGQAFGWKSLKKSASGKTTQWTGVIQDVVYNIKQTSKDTHWRALNSDNCFSDPKQLICDYFWLKGGRGCSPTLTSRYERWSQADQRFNSIAPKFQGVRLLRQDPVECLISFLCSSNNNIKRISLMLTKLRMNYGSLLGEFDGMSYFSFPTLEQLSRAKEEDLRDLGFGYRAKFIVRTVEELSNKPGGGKEWLLSLRERPGDEIQSELIEFCGVGRKVADCVALFSLDALERVPVDVHVLKITMRDYGNEFKPQAVRKSLTKLLYNEVGDFWMSKFGDDAGWAHSVLFCADLPDYKRRLEQPENIKSGGKRRKVKK